MRNPHIISGRSEVVRGVHAFREKCKGYEVTGHFPAEIAVDVVLRLS